jgi:hypothetical protein
MNLEPRFYRCYMHADATSSEINTETPIEMLQNNSLVLATFKASYWDREKDDKLPIIRCILEKVFELTSNSD